MTPKSLLRFPQASSSLEEITTGAFKKVIWDQKHPSPKSIEKIILCSGKVYYDLKDAVEKEKKEKITIARLEQLYPFPKEDISELFAKFSNAKQVVWAQEEPRNQGAWYFVREKMEGVLPSKSSLQYAGRKESPSPAAGMVKIHQKEQQELVAEAIQ